MEKEVREINKLKEAIVVYSSNMNNTSYESKTPLEREIDVLCSALHLHLEKYERTFKGERECHAETKQDILATKMMKISNALRQGDSAVVEDVADDFLRTLEYFDIAREAKEKGKTIALKDKYSKI